MDTLTLLMFMMLVVLVVIVIQLRRGAGGTCKCPIDDKWVEDFGKWVEAEDKWAGQVQDWIVGYDKCLAEKCDQAMVKVPPPNPPPCEFGSC